MSLLPNNPLMTLAQGNQTPIGAPGVPQQSGFQQFSQGLLNNPLFGLGIGLLSGAQRGGTFAGGAQLGLLNMMNMQRQQQATALMGARLEEMRRKRQAEERQQKNREALFANLDPNMAAYYRAGLEPPKPVTPMSAIGKLQADLTAGRIDQGQYNTALTKMGAPSTIVNVAGNRPEMGEARQIAQTESSLDTIGRLEQLAQDPANFMGPTRAAVGQLESMPVVGDVLQSQFPMTPGQYETMSLSTQLSNEVIAAARGAQVGPAEQERYERQLPVPGQPMELYMKNLANTRRNLEFLRKRTVELRQLDVDEPDTMEPTEPTTRESYTREELEAEARRRGLVP